MNKTLVSSLALSLFLHVMLIAIPNKSGPELTVSNHPDAIQINLVDTSKKKPTDPTPLPNFKEDLLSNLESPITQDKIEEDATEIDDLEQPDTSIGMVEDLSPEVVTNTPPNYPYLARKRGYEGTVILRVSILTTGLPGTIKVLASSGYDILDHSAIEAVQKWSFIPAKNGVQSVKQWVEIPIQFQLNSNT